MCGSALLIIQNHVDEWEMLAKKDKRIKTRKECSYISWAASELQNRLIEESFQIPSYILEWPERKTPIDVVEEFILEMESYAIIATDEGAQTVFSTALIFGEYVLYLFSHE